MVMLMLVQLSVAGFVSLHLCSKHCYSSYAAAPNDHFTAGPDGAVSRLGQSGTSSAVAVQVSSVHPAPSGYLRKHIAAASVLTLQQLPGLPSLASQESNGSFEPRHCSEL